MLRPSPFQATLAISIPTCTSVSVILAELLSRSSSNWIPVAEGNTVMTVEPPYLTQHKTISIDQLKLTWNQPNSSPFTTLSPGFLDHPMEPTNIANYQLSTLHKCGSPPIATKAIGTDSLPGPRFALMIMTDRLFKV